MVGALPDSLSSRPEDATTVTHLLQEMRTGDREAINKLLPLVYHELHQIARRQRARWHGDYTLNTTALVHEAYLKLAGADQTLSDRAHFMAVAARAMRQLLVDQARRRQSQKRGGEVERTSLEHLQGEQALDLELPDDRILELIALDDALERLAATDERQACVVECRFFAGLTIEETAQALDLSPATIKVYWSLARTWLFREMGR